MKCDIINDVKLVAESISQNILLQIFESFQVCKCIRVYSKTCLKHPLSKRLKICFQHQLTLNAGQNDCRMLQGEHLQYFRPSLSYQLSFRSLFCLFLSGCSKLVLLYHHFHVQTCKSYLTLQNLKQNKLISKKIHRCAMQKKTVASIL